MKKDKNINKKLARFEKLSQVKRNEVRPELLIVHQKNQFVYAGNVYYMLQDKTEQGFKGKQNKITDSLVEVFNKALEDNKKSNRITVNRNFLIDILKNLDTEQVQLFVSRRDKTPVVISGDQNQKAILMPLK